jgi:hypothetical protein
METVLYLPVLAMLLWGMVELARITYTYYTLQKILYTLARLVGTQQGVNFCDSGDEQVKAAKNFALTGSSDGSTDSLVPNLTIDEIAIRIERYNQRRRRDAGVRLLEHRMRRRRRRRLARLPGGVPHRRLQRAAGDTLHVLHGFRAAAHGPRALRRNVMRAGRWGGPPGLQAGLRAGFVPLRLRAALRCDSGQQIMEFVILYGGVLMPIICALIFTAQVLWVWHSVIEFARDGAPYAATHCWQSAGDNVLEYMRNNVPYMIDRDQFQNAGADLISITYYSRDADSGYLVEYTCSDGECSTLCVPDVVTVRIQGYEFAHAFLTRLGLPAITIPDFRTSMRMESAGCDPETGECSP